MAVPLRPLPVVGGADIEIGLNQHGGRRRIGIRRRNKNAAETGDQQKRTAAGPGPATRKASFGLTPQQQTAGQQGIDCNQNKADAIDAGPGRELVDQCVVHLRVAELIPGNAGDAGGGQFQAGPQDGREDEGEARGAGGAAHQRDAEPEEAEVEPQHQAEPDEQQRGSKRRHVAVVHHGVANPVAIAHVPQKAAEIGDKKGAAERMAAGWSAEVARTAQRSGTSANQAKTERQGGIGPASGNGNSSRPAERTAAAHGFQERVHTGPSVKHSDGLK